MACRIICIYCSKCKGFGQGNRRLKLLKGMAKVCRRELINEYTNYNKKRIRMKKGTYNNLECVLFEFTNFVFTLLKKGQFTLQ